MSNLIKVKGDLLQLAEEGKFDVIVHGCGVIVIHKKDVADKFFNAGYKKIRQVRGFFVGFHCLVTKSKETK